VIAASLIRSRLLLLGAVLLTSGACRSEACDEWTERVGRLQGSARAELVTYGAVDDGEWVLFSDSLIADCSLRAHLSRFTGNVVRGTSQNADDVNAVRGNSGTLVKALMSVWPTSGKRFPGEDGAFRSELSSLLVTPELEVSTIRPLLSKIIKDDGLTGEVAYGLLSRPDPALRPEIARFVEVSDSGVTDANIFAIAILQRLGDDVDALIEVLSKRDDLSQTKRDVISLLLKKSRAGEQPSWDDISDLEHE
jgi:hypothetical protein